MSLIPTTIGDNAQIPGASAQVYVPDQLIAGPLNLVTDTGTLASGTLERGTVLGQITADGTYVKSVKTAADGSQVPSAILVNQVADASAGPIGIGVYLMGEFNQNALVMDASWTVAALKSALRTYAIFVKSSVSAADPT